MRKSCAQVADNCLQTSCITAWITHSPEHIKGIWVQKCSSYTTRNTALPAYVAGILAQENSRFYRLVRIVIPTMHRAYIQDNNVHLINI
jgi:hypothetical protein